MKCFLLLFRTFFAVCGILVFCVAGPRMAGDDVLPNGAQSVGMLTMPRGASARQVQQAIVTSLTKRSWIVKSVDDSTVVGYLKHRGYEATLTFRYDENHIEIISDSYEIDSDGKRLERKNPTRWIDYLKQDIPHYLAVEMQPAK